MTAPETEAAPRLARPFVMELDSAVEADPSQVPQLIDTPPMGAVQGMGQWASAPVSGFGRFAAWVFGALLSLVLSAAAWNFVSGLFAANSLLGWVGLALTGLAALILLVMAVQELLAFSRQGRLDHLREACARASTLAQARAAVDGVAQLYRGRADLAWGRQRLAEQRDGAMDPEALLALTETELMQPLDRAALAQVERAARQVATVTAFVPLALADVVVVLFANLRMIRAMSEIYGGRSGRLGSLRLLRRVAGAVLGAGAVALADDMLGSFAGGGLLGKVSRRFGEGVVNGALTARLGLAAMEELRPMPFRATVRPGVSSTVSRALAGLFSKGEPGKEPGTT